VEHQQPSEAEPVTVPAGTDICGAPATTTVVVTTTDGGPEHTALLRAAAGTATATVPTPSPPDGQRHELVEGWCGGGVGCGVTCACGVTFDGFETIAGAKMVLNQHIALAAVDQPQDAPAADVAVVQTCGRPAVSGVATSPQPWRWPGGTPPYAGTIWTCDRHESVVVETAQQSGLHATVVAAPAQAGCGGISGDGVELPAGAWPRRSVLAAANATADAVPVTDGGMSVRAAELRPGMWIATGRTDVPGIEVRAVEIGGTDPGPVSDDGMWSRADELRPGLWVATGRDDVPGVEVRAVEISVTGLVGVLLAGPEYAEYQGDQPVRLVDEATVDAAAEALRVRTRRQLMLDGLRALVAAAERDPGILPVDRLQVTGRAESLAALQTFAADLDVDVVPAGERLVAEHLVGGGPADDLGGSSAPLSIEMYVYADPEPAAGPPARGTAVVVPARPAETGGVQ
jgi:hypothetical protein